MTVVTVPKIIGEAPPIGLGTFSPLGNTLQGQAEAIIRKYSASVYLPSTQNFSDSAGTTPAVNDGSVGYVAGQAVGAELIADPSFDTPASWTLGQPTSGSVSISGGQLTINSIDGSYCYASIPMTIVAGKSYKWEIDYTSTGGQGVAVDLGGVNGAALTGSGIATGIITATNGNAIAIKRGGGIANSGGIVRSASVRELGYIATQSTAGYKPTLKSAGRPYYWSFDGTDDRLSLSGPLFQMSDDHFVVACARPNAYSSALFDQRSTASVTPIIGKLGVAPGGSIEVIWRDDAGTITQDQIGSAVAIGEVFVAALTKQGNIKIGYKNGVAGSYNTTAMGTTTITGAAIGASPQATVSQFWNGQIYCVIAGKGTITAAELMVLMRYAGSLGGKAI